MVSASLNGTSYSAQAEMDIGELTLQVSSLTAPTTAPIQVNSDIQHNGNTRCFNTLTMDYSGNAQTGPNSTRESVAWGSGSTTNASIDAGAWSGSSFLQTNTYDSNGTGHLSFFATPTQTKLVGNNISIGLFEGVPEFDGSGVQECTNLFLKGNNIVIDAGTPNAATGGTTGSLTINGVCQAEYLQALHFNVPTVCIGAPGPSTYGRTVQHLCMST